MSGIDVNTAIGIGQLAAVCLLAGVCLERLKHTRDRQNEDRKDAKDALERLDAKVDAKLEKLRSESLALIASGDAARDTRIEKIENRIDKLETNLDEKMDAVVTKIETVVSGIQKQLGDVASQVGRLEGKLSGTR